MPRLDAAQLLELGIRILTAAGVSAEDAAVVASELRDANLVGHDSHGVIRLPQYIASIEAGQIRPSGQVSVIDEGTAHVVMDADFQFGQVAARRMLRLLQDKVETSGTVSGWIRNANHVGRLGSYTAAAARQGLVAIMTVNAPGPGGVAPFGGSARRLGTNPISIAAPAPTGPLVLDMTTSSVAEGKLRVARQRGDSVPEGWLINGRGEATTDPAEFYDDPPGALLPLGGPLGFKGSGLSIMIDVISGMLSGSGVCRTDLPPGANGVWFYLVDVQRIVGQEVYDSWMKQYVPWIKDCPRLPGIDEILLPGEIEQRRMEQRLAEGVPIAAATWQALDEMAVGLGCSIADLGLPD